MNPAFEKCMKGFLYLGMPVAAWALIHNQLTDGRQGGLIQEYFKPVAVEFREATADEITDLVIVSDNGTRYLFVGSTESGGRQYRSIDETVSVIKNLDLRELYRLKLNALQDKLNRIGDY